MSGAVDFLKWFRPEGPWILTSIVPDGRISTMTFRADQEDKVMAWLEPKLGFENLYFTVNITDGPMMKKPLKDDIVEAQWIHVDVDPEGTNLAVERKRILKRLEEHVPKPSLILDSGGGFQGFWRLSEPVRLDDWTEFERYNQQMEKDLCNGHTQCWNVDRIMRLPGTVNVPTKKKAKQGREKADAIVYYKDDVTYNLDVFPQAPLVDGGERGDIGRREVTLSGNIPTLADPDDLDQYGEVSQLVKMLIVQGEDPDRPDRWASRSELTWFIVCELIRCEIPDEIIAAVLLDPDFLISGHCLDQKNPEGYVIRQIQRGHEYAINEDLPNMNDDHFVTIIGGKIKVVKEVTKKTKAGQNVRDLEYMDPGSFEKFLSNQRVEVGTSANGTPQYMKKGKWWIEHPQRRSYHGIMFAPDNEIPDGYYNLWRGFSCNALEGKNHLRYLDHLFENICRGNQEHYDYLIRWISRVMQDPATQSETAIVLRGKEGTGKNTLIQPLKMLMPEHFFEAASAAQFIGNFNSHLRDKLIVHGNEAFFAGDKRHEAALKMLITEETMPVEAKGIDIRQEHNYLHLIMSSNSDWVVPAGPESRRFFVLDVGDGKMQDEGYFASLHKELKSDGLSHLLRFLLELDLSEWSVRKVPLTDALRQQRLHTMPSEVKWWMTVLEAGAVGSDRDGWQNRMKVDAIWNSYVRQMDDEKVSYRMSKNQLGTFLKKAVPSIEKKVIQSGGDRGNYYLLPDLGICREHFDSTFGGPFEWTDCEIEQEEIPF